MSWQKYLTSRHIDNAFELRENSMKTSVTISLLPSSPKMPFVLGPDLREGVATAAACGFDAFELFPPRLDLLDSKEIQGLCDEFEIEISTIGTGGGAVSQGLTLTDPDKDIRHKGQEYVRSIIEIAGDLGACAIIGSMQGRAGDRGKDEVMAILADSLAELGDYATKWEKPLLYEPLNRYETDLANTLDDAAAALVQAGSKNTLLLADLFHMNIEEPCIATSLRNQANMIGHVHFVDSNRWSMGAGHLNVGPILEVLKESGYDQYLAVEAFPLPNQKAAAENAMQQFRDLGIVS